MKVVASLVLSLFLLFSCGTNINTKEKKYSKIHLIHLNEVDMFNYTMVQAYLKQNLKPSEEYKLLFLKGLEHYKNSKNLDSAKYYLTQSILEKPTDMAYYELGNLLTEQKKYDEAIFSYELADKLGYEPFFKVLYNLSCVHSLKDQTDLAGAYLEYAIQAGYSNLENIKKDKNLKNLRADTYVYNYHFKRGLKGLTNAENILWMQFKRQFNNTKLPLDLSDKLDILLLTDETSISYDFEKYISEMRDEKFSRETSKGFYYLAKLKETNDYVALIYVVKEEFFEGNAPLTFKVATFNNVGELIDKKEIAGRYDLSKPLKEAKISKDFLISITSYETEFEKDPAEYGYYDNKIINKNKLGEEIYTINPAGKIVVQSSENSLSYQN